MKGSKFCSVMPQKRKAPTKIENCHLPIVFSFELFPSCWLPLKFHCSALEITSSGLAQPLVFSVLHSATGCVFSFQSPAINFKGRWFDFPVPHSKFHCIRHFQMCWDFFYSFFSFLKCISLLPTGFWEIQLEIASLFRSENDFSLYFIGLTDNVSSIQ